jgi:hypothetical protein
MVVNYHGYVRGVVEAICFKVVTQNNKKYREDLLCMKVPEVS